MHPSCILTYVIVVFRMLETFEMDLILRQNFYDFFEEHRYNSDDGELMYRMEAFDKTTVNDSSNGYVWGRTNCKLNLNATYLKSISVNLDG